MSYLTVFGLFFFMMFWEAQNKQLYNHIPWMTFCVVWAMRSMHSDPDSVRSA